MSDFIQYVNKKLTRKRVQHADSRLTYTETKEKRQRHIKYLPKYITDYEIKKIFFCLTATFKTYYSHNYPHQILVDINTM